MDSYQKFISEKAKKKRELMGKMFFPRKPILLLDFSENPELEKYDDLLEGLEEIGLTTLILSGKDERMPGNSIHYIPAEKAQAAYEAADLVVEMDNNNLARVWAGGGVPISRQNGDSTVNYNPLQEKGNGFYFKNPTKWELFAAIVRALETYQFPYDWENLIREILARGN